MNKLCKYVRTQGVDSSTVLEYSRGLGRGRMEDDEEGIPDEVFSG